MMKREVTYRYMAQLFLLLTVLLLVACSSGEEDDGENAPCYVEISVYSPAHPMLTRADAGYADASDDDENKVHSLQIWVFKHNNGELLGYMADTPTDFTEDGKAYRIAVTPAIAEGGGSERSVDVYVLANVSSSTCGLSLNENTTRSELDEAKIEGSHFGVSPLQSSVANGIPMSGVLKNEPVYGNFPVLRIGTESQMSSVKLARAVSKLRFVLCRVHDGSNPASRLKEITSISLKGNQIPMQEYLMLGSAFDNSTNPAAPLSDARIRIVPDVYEEDAIDFTPPAIDDIPIVDNPLDYVYDPMVFSSLQEYEDYLKTAIGEKNLVQVGPVYLRESDKRLEGKIAYRVESDGDAAPARTADFSMTSVGDFSRDHSWTVYVFFTGGKLQVFQVVQVGIKRWTMVSEQGNHEVYNW